MLRFAGSLARYVAGAHITVWPAGAGREGLSVLVGGKLRVLVPVTAREKTLKSKAMFDGPRSTEKTRVVGGATNDSVSVPVGIGRSAAYRPMYGGFPARNSPTSTS